MTWAIVLMVAGGVAYLGSVRLTLSGHPSQPWLQSTAIVATGIFAVAMFTGHRLAGALLVLLAAFAYLAWARTRPGTARAPGRVAWLRPVVLVRRGRQIGFVMLAISMYEMLQGDLFFAGATFAAAVAFVVAHMVLMPRIREEERIASEGPGPDPVVLLRSFERDDLTEGESLIGRSIRERFGTFIAFGNGEEDFPGLGASRIRVPDEDWRKELTRLARTARLLVLFPGDSPSLRWELAMVLREGLAGRLAVIHVRDRVPWAGAFLAKAVGVEIRGWADFAEALRASGFEVPDEPETDAVVRFDERGRCVGVRSGLRTPREIVDALAEFDSLAR